MKFSIVGCGYVGFSVSLLISQKHEVIIYEIDEDRVNLINKNISPLPIVGSQDFMEQNSLNIKATSKTEEAFKDPDYIIIAVPTNYNDESGKFDTSILSNIISEIISLSINVPIIIKSTVPYGYTEEQVKRHNFNDIYFSPEFLREDKALIDNLYPSRIIIGGETEKAKNFVAVLSDCSKQTNEENSIFFMKSNEAEAVKLFSNTHLAMRISFFNELDTFCEIKGLSTKKVINGVCSDPRIGKYYNNPSFGYGGYCLPKDSKQLLSNFEHVPNNIISAVVNANETRKKFIIDTILDKNVVNIGIYRLVMKFNSDNFRESAVIDIIKELKKNNIKIYVYEPFIKDNKSNDYEICNNLEEFIIKSDLILANRNNSDLEKVKEKVYSRDIFGNN